LGDSPVCGEVVEVKPGEDINIAVSNHIDAGCPKSAKVVTFGCCCPGCKTEELVPCICNLCGKNTCLKHRFPADHCCARTASSVKPAKTTAAPPPAKLTADKTVAKPEPAKRTKSAEQMARTEQYLEVQRQSKKKNESFMHRFQISKAKASAQGNQSIPAERREYLEIVFPLSGKVKSANARPIYMFFDVKWSIGKSLCHLKYDYNSYSEGFHVYNHFTPCVLLFIVLDEVAAKGSVPNRNHIAGAPVCFIYIFIHCLYPTIFLSHMFVCCYTETGVDIVADGNCSSKFKNSW